MELRHRRRVSWVIRFGLIAVALGLVASWGLRKLPGRGQIGVVSEVPPVEALAPGDLRIFSVDSATDVILRGHQILAGLSPQTVARVRAEMEKSANDDTAGLGGSIAKAVKATVADKIGMHVAYDIEDIRDIRYEDGTLVLEWKRGGEQRVLGKAKVDGKRDSNQFHEADARRLIAAFHARR